jgi:hypothetical protein
MNAQNRFCTVHTIRWCSFLLQQRSGHVAELAKPLQERVYTPCSCNKVNFLTQFSALIPRLPRLHDLAAPSILPSHRLEYITAPDDIHELLTHFDTGSQHFPAPAASQLLNLVGCPRLKLVLETWSLLVCPSMVVRQVENCKSEQRQALARSILHFSRQLQALKECRGSTMARQGFR